MTAFNKIYPVRLLVAPWENNVNKNKDSLAEPPPRKFPDP